MSVWLVSLGGFDAPLTPCLMNNRQNTGREMEGWS